LGEIPYAGRGGKSERNGGWLEKSSDPPEGGKEKGQPERIPCYKNQNLVKGGGKKMENVWEPCTHKERRRELGKCTPGRRKRSQHKIRTQFKAASHAERQQHGISGKAGKAPEQGATCLDCQ